jgi:hypothetical protein
MTLMAILSRFCGFVKKSVIFWLTHCSLIIAEAILIAYSPSQFRLAQVIVLAISSFLYILIILSYVDPYELVEEKEVRVSVTQVDDSNQHLTVKLGVITNYDRQYKVGDVDSCVVMLDDEAEEHRVVESNVRVVHPSRGFVTEFVHGVYKKVRFK